MKAAIARSLRILNCPAIFPIVDNSSLRLYSRANHLGQLLQRFAKLRYIAEYACVLMANMVNYSAVQLLA
ncbi:hypothetical protein D3C71_1874910 [compost metagenome]